MIREIKVQDRSSDQGAFCKELGHWKVDCPKAKGKKESKTEANLTQVVSTHTSTSQVDGSDSDSSVFSFLLLLLLVTQVILSRY